MTGQYGKFTWNGEEFQIIPSGKWSMDEAIAVEGWAGGDLTVMTKMQLATGVAWVAISRRLPGFTIQDAGRQLDIELALDILKAQKAASAAAPADHRPGVVLSPSSAEPSPDANRAARRSAKKQTGTAPRSRSTTASSRGKSHD